MPSVVVAHDHSPKVEHLRRTGAPPAGRKFTTARKKHQRKIAEHHRLAGGSRLIDSASPPVSAEGGRPAILITQKARRIAGTLTSHSFRNSFIAPACPWAYASPSFEDRSNRGSVPAAIVPQPYSGENTAWRRARRWLTKPGSRSASKRCSSTARKTGEGAGRGEVTGICHTDAFTLSGGGPGGPLSGDPRPRGRRHRGRCQARGSRPSRRATM